MIVIKCKIVFMEDLLGTANSNPNIHSDYIASKAPDALSREEEVMCIGAEAVEEKQKTVFPKDADGNPLVFDYQVKGMIKGNIKALRRCKGESFSAAACKMAASIKVSDENIHIFPRKIPIHLSGPIGDLQRPLRATGPQGERVALANSETVPAGSWIAFRIECDVRDSYKAVVEALNYGTRNGMGQWRSAGWGRFDVQDLEILDVSREIEIPEPKKGSVK